jgi:hypothetical protein
VKPQFDALPIGPIGLYACMLGFGPAGRFRGFGNRLDRARGLSNLLLGEKPCSAVRPAPGSSDPFAAFGSWSGGGGRATEGRFRPLCYVDEVSAAIDPQIADGVMS